MVQSFQKISELAALAPTQSEPPFLLAQAALLAAFVWAGWRAVKGFHPRAAAILNLTPDHLERHGTMESYGAHKCRMFARMGPADFAIVPVDDPRLIPFADVPAVPFSEIMGDLAKISGKNAESATEPQ